MVVAVVRNGTKFSQCNIAWGGFPWDRGSILVDALLRKEKKRKGKRKQKKNHCGGGGFPRGWTHLAGYVAGHSC
jgi:hypothetical protein